MDADLPREYTRSPSLELLGAFALTQVMCDEMFVNYFEERAPEAIKFLRERALLRISDGERLSLAVRIAEGSAATNYSARFREVYLLVKEIRDGIAHGYMVDETVFTEPQWLVANAEGKRRGVQHPEELRSSYISLMARHCEWLQDVLVQIGIAIGAIETVNDPDPPPDRPQAWGTVSRAAIDPTY